MNELPDVNAMTTHEAAMKYAENGIAVFPIVPNCKNPLTPNGFKDATADMDVNNQAWHRASNANVGMATGTVNGIMVVDVDCKNGVNGEESLHELEKYYGNLPVTRKHNTPSGGYHLLFRIASMAVPSSASSIGDGLDVRADGGYVVAPPSAVKNDKCSGKYIVENPEVPIADAPEWLIKIACERKSVEKKTVKNAKIPDGLRNNHIFRTAIECNKHGLSHAEAVQKALIENMKCNPPLEADEVIRTVSSAYKYDVSNIPAEIVDMNKTHAVIKVGGNCYVLNEIDCPTIGRPDFELLNVKGFKDFNCNRYVTIDGKKQRLGDAWFNHPDRRQYNGIVFNPKRTPEGYYNIWKGFATEPQEGDCSLYLKHIDENIANGDKAVYDYIIAWMAQTIQHPDVLVGVAIVMRGAMGVGKGVFVEHFGKLFGRHYMLLNDSGLLTGKFNGHMKDKCLLFADEAFWAGDKAAEGKLKSMITESTINVEMKGKDAYSIKNNLHMIFATNNDWAAPCGARERRFFVIDVGEKHLQDTVYFKAIANQMDNGGREALLHYLMNYDVSGMDLRKFPQTAALRESKLLTATPVQKFWYHLLDSGCLHPTVDGWGNGTVLTEYMHNSYTTFVQNMGSKHKSTETELGTQLKKMLPKDRFKKSRLTVSDHRGKQVRKNCYIFPTLEECRESFEVFMNSKFDWITD